MHPTLPYILTCSDDMLIKLWDWDKGWACTQIFEGHSHYVMQVGRQGQPGRWKSLPACQSCMLILPACLAVQCG